MSGRTLNLAVLAMGKSFLGQRTAAPSFEEDLVHFVLVAAVAKGRLL